ncbi:unnamed protein product [Sphacelaria rigidula]
MMVSVWGPPGWKFLHTVAHGYPENPREFDESCGYTVGSTEANYKNFFTLVGNTLPCALCRESYKKFMIENPVRASSREDLTRWLWEIHNKVNKKLDRVYQDADFESVTQSYERSRAKCSKDPNAKGCTEALHPSLGCRITIPPFVPIHMPCFYLKMMLILSALAFLYSRSLEKPT